MSGGATAGNSSKHKIESSNSKPSNSKPSDAQSLKRKRGVFHKDLQHIMYGYGDDPNLASWKNGEMEEGLDDQRWFTYARWTFNFRPLPETVALVEDIVVEYVTDLVHKAQEVASKRGKMLTEDYLFLIRKDLPKFNRCTELLAMNEELKQARKAFEVDEEKLATVD